MRFNLNDLFTHSWGSMPCGVAVAEGLRRMGQPDAADHLPTDQESASRLLAALTATGGPWAMIGTDRCCARPGDVLVSETPGEDWHVSLCTDPVYALTSTRSHGVHRIRIARMQRVTGVYRFQGVPA